LEYATRLERRGIAATVLVVELKNGRMHAIVSAANRHGTTVLVDPTTGTVCFEQDYTDGRILGGTAYAMQ
jgi:fructoselysine-6-P-deglycase FrlB-like protein